MAKRRAPSITDQDAAPKATADLCDRLYTLLAQRIERLERSKVGRWCCFFPEGENNFAYVTHRKRKRRLEVWFAGANGDESRFPQPDIRLRSTTDILHWLRLIDEHYRDLRPTLVERFPDLEEAA